MVVADVLMSPFIGNRRTRGEEEEHITRCMHDYIYIQIKVQVKRFIKTKK